MSFSSSKECSPPSNRPADLGERERAKVTLWASMVEDGLESGSPAIGLSRRGQRLIIKAEYTSNNKQSLPLMVSATVICARSQTHSPRLCGPICISLSTIIRLLCAPKQNRSRQIIWESLEGPPVKAGRLKTKWTMSASVH